MGGGLDTFTWGPGEGNDIVEGGAGTDFLQMNGSGGNDRFDVVPVGSRTRVTRDIENVNLDLGGLERVDLLPGPGGDIVRVADLSGTSTDRVDVNLMVARGQIGGDNLIDRVFIDGTFGNDTINVNGAGPGRARPPAWRRSPPCAAPTPSSTGCTSTPSPASTRSPSPGRRIS